jgi:hypothetical protein
MAGLSWKNWSRRIVNRFGDVSKGHTASESKAKMAARSDGISTRSSQRRKGAHEYRVKLKDAAGEQRIEVHGEVVDGRTAGFGDVFGAGARLSVEKSSDVADFDFFFGADLSRSAGAGK